MAQQLIERAWAWLHSTFPERQIYIRSEGRVQFFTFSSTLQATCAGLGLIFLGWVAFASVNVVFKDRILAARDHHYHEMQGAYENRVADLQLSYDELNDALISAEDRFRTTVDELSAKQRSISGLVGKRPGAEGLSYLPGDASRGEQAIRKGADATNRAGVASDGPGTAKAPFASPGYAPPSGSSRASHGRGESDLEVMPGGIEPQPRTSRPKQAAMIEGSLFGIAAALLRLNRPEQDHTDGTARELKLLAQQTSRASKLSRSETRIVAAYDSALTRQIGTAKGILAQLGMNVSRQRSALGTGGSLEPVSEIRMAGISDSRFVSTYSHAVAHEEQLTALLSRLDHVPFVAPVNGPQFTFSSGFGPRVDPFTGRVAFHTGIDLAGPWGSSVYATASGTVVWAGYRGGYGNMVEIDHGDGIRTRYGHLSFIAVRVGMKVHEGSIVGRMGSTGRSTGPHVHYEVWFADSARNPDIFLQLGRHFLRPQS